MLVPRHIERKRDGLELEPDAIQSLIAGFAQRQVSEAQMAAFCMAACLRGLSFDETAALTHALLQTDPPLPGFGESAVDKCTTGGIGDNLSLALTPLVAAQGAYVPVVAGYGAGARVGTLDKLACIPGFQPRLSATRFRRVVKQVGCAMALPIGRRRPAFQRLDDLLQTSGTAVSLPLSSACRMARKLSSGIPGLVVHIPFGPGAAVAQTAEARAQARLMAAVGRRLGRRVTTLISWAGAPLGRAIGAGPELRESIEVLSGYATAETRLLLCELGAELLALAGIETHRALARQRLHTCLERGDPRQVLARMIAAQQGDARVIDRPERLPFAPVTRDVPAPQAGFVNALDLPALGAVAVALGVGTPGRHPAVGIDRLLRPGEAVDLHQPLMRLHGESRAAVESQIEPTIRAVRLADGPPAAVALIDATHPDPETMD